MSDNTEGFDPLVEFAGRWTTDLAERYLPIEGMPFDRYKYECWDGHLIITERDPVAIRVAQQLAGILAEPAERAGYHLAGPVRVVSDEDDN